MYLHVSARLAFEISKPFSRLTDAHLMPTPSVHAPRLVWRCLHQLYAHRLISAVSVGRQHVERRAKSYHTANMAESREFKTSILPVDVHSIGKLQSIPRPDDLLDDLDIELDEHSPNARHLRLAAEQLKSSDIPVAFPTETVYGLGGDAQRSASVLGIYKAKQRPADNPLIVHIASLTQLRTLLRSGLRANGVEDGPQNDPIPTIYHPLIERFWPGPLTIIVPNPRKSSLAPEVTAGLDTFGARMPRHILALALIKLSGVPVAAPSANASTKPSPTAAEHVAYDLNGRIETILDGDDCDIGVESTVVDGLSQPPLILRPGGISIEQLRTCPGWEDTQVGYKNVAEIGSQPKAPGMKYRHYSPKAPVILFEHGTAPPDLGQMREYVRQHARLGIITTRRWRIDARARPEPITHQPQHEIFTDSETNKSSRKTLPGFAGLLQDLQNARPPRQALQMNTITIETQQVDLLDIPLGSDTSNIARGTFSALRELDRANVDAIFVEGIDDAEGDLAAAVMNRLRKAAEVNISS